MSAEGFTVLGSVAQLEKAGYLQIKGIAVSKNSANPKQPIAVNTTCTHSGCEVKWSAGEKRYECPCHDAEFAAGYDEDYENFKVGVQLRQARESAGITQDEVAEKLNTKKSAISRIENHSEDIRLSTLRKYAEALGKQIHLEIS